MPAASRPVAVLEAPLAKENPEGAEVDEPKPPVGFGVDERSLSSLEASSPATDAFPPNENPEGPPNDPDDAFVPKPNPVEVSLGPPNFDSDAEPLKLLLPKIFGVAEEEA